MESLVGNKYGKLTVLKRAENEILSNGHIAVRYLCQCDCGKKSIVRATALKKGSTRSCGCSRKDSMLNKNVIDMTGQRFGSWTVVGQSKSNPNREAVWKCQCDCGKIKLFTRRALLKGTKLICPNCKNTNSDFNVIQLKTKLIGERFSRWTVIDYAGIRKGKNGREYRQWKCICDCGTIRNVDEFSLLSHKSTSCGCYRKERVAASVTYDDISGRRFGKLVVLSRDGSKHYPGGGQSQIYKCQCDCGNTTRVARAMLISGQTESCGCGVYSKMERWCSDYLFENNIDFKTHVMFDNLKGIHNGPLSYDFGIYDNDICIGLIECQGEQHFKSVNYFGGEDKFEIQQKHDALKRQFALDNKIPLLELTYKLTKNDFISLLKTFVEKRHSK